MNNASDEKSFRYLQISESRVETSAITADRVHLQILFGSFEPRCMSFASSASLLANFGIVFQFSAPEETSDDSRKSSAKSLFDKLTLVTDKTALIQLPKSTEVAAVREILKESIYKIYRSIGRSIVVGIDITTCPKVFFFLSNFFWFCDWHCERI